MIDIRDLCDKRACGLEALKWAEVHKGAITISDIPSQYISFNKELYSLLGAKTGGTAKNLRAGLQEGNALEHLALAAD